ncbi:MAG: DUF3426 domain-containing protein [Alphaproteobacteria bacterium]|nr:DUF3426 domain-containing protein [Alphaproteobacteria bacterium]
MIDPAVLPPGGRLVRCAKCSHTWHEQPPPDAPPPPPPEPPPVLRPLPPGSNLPAIPESRSGGGWRAWALLVLFIAAIAASGWYGKERIVEAWPAAARIYATLGIPLAPPREFGLVLRDLSSSTASEDGASVLTISGEVANVIAEARPLPKLRVILRDGEKRTIREWTHDLEGSDIAPGESRRFTTKLREPPAEARDLEVTFLVDETTRP